MDSVKLLLMATATLSLFFIVDSNKRPHHLYFSEEIQRDFFQKTSHLRIVALKLKCGRMKNRMVVFEDGTKACCRYRENPNELRGDLYSYYLSKVLGTWNVPPAILVRLDINNEQWKTVAHDALAAGWKNGHSMVLSMYIDDLQPEYLPEELKGKNSLLTRTVMLTKFPESEERLLQWSDLIVTDYLTGHSDRLFCNLINLQWTPTMLNKPIHNLARTKSNSSLILFDNESAFCIGYGIARHNQKYYQLQREFLQRICMFRDSTVQALRSMRRGTNPVSKLKNEFKVSDSVGFAELGELPNKAWSDFNSRLNLLMMRIEECKRH